MTIVVYVVLRSGGRDLGEGYSEGWNDQLMSIESTFDKARKEMEILANQLGYGTDELAILDEDWDFVELQFSDSYKTWVRLHIETRTMEVG